MTARLPAPLEEVRIPYFLPPSRAHELARCALRVLGEPSSLLPPTPPMLLGSLLHHVREQVLRGRWAGAKEPDRAYQNTFDRAAAELDALLTAESTTAGVAPLRDAVGRTRWESGRHEGLEWSRTVRVAPSDAPPAPVALPNVGTPSGMTGPEADRVDEGAEAWVVSRRLRLRGRADRVHDAGATIDITDYKSGKVLDLDGDVLEHHRLQVRLYGLAAEEVTGRPARLFLQAAARIDVPWDQGVKDSIQEWLSDLRAALPEGAIVPAQALASPGAVCCGCRVRLACREYMHQAPKWWPYSPSAARPLPLDVWGTVRDIRAGSTMVAVELEDPAGRRVRIDGLALERAEHLAVGASAYFFNLQGSEPTIMHGVRIQPRNFHEFPQRRGLQRARNLQVFVD